VTSMVFFRRCCVRSTCSFRKADVAASASTTRSCGPTFDRPGKQMGTMMPMRSTMRSWVSRPALRRPIPVDCRSWPGSLSTVSLNIFPGQSGERRSGLPGGFKSRPIRRPACKRRAQRRAPNGLIAWPFHHWRSGPSRKTAKWRCGASGGALPVVPT